MSEQTEHNPYLEGVTDDQVLQIAAMAEAAAPFLNFQHQMHIGRTLKMFQSTAYEHSKAIMELKALDMAMQQIQKDFRGITTRAAQIIARQAAENDPARKEQQRLNKQGFGL